MRLIALSAAFVASLSLFACASSDHTGIGGGTSPTDPSATVPAATDAASFCAAMCSREQSCDKALDTQTCVNECTNADAAVFPRLRTDVVDLIVSCFDSKDCKTVLGGSFVGACTADAIASVAPSAAASTYCDALAKAKNTCSGSSALTKADCLNTAKLYGDAAIAQAQNCAKRGCSEIDACVSAVFGSLGHATGTTTPTSSCSGTITDLGTCSACAASSCCAEATACEADSACHSIARYCLGSGTSSSCSSYYSSASSSSQQLASALFSCGSSSCSSTCKVGM
jgi:hypothetical protein